MNKLFANHIGYSDIEPFEVVKVISDKTIEIRRMEAERDLTWKPEIIPGGFAGHCVNQNEQRWNITSNEKNQTIRIRLSKNKGWKDKHGRQFKLSDKPRKYYDYNF
jgi:uncharacterized membrane protein